MVGGIECGVEGVVFIALLVHLDHEITIHVAAPHAPRPTVLRGHTPSHTLPSPRGLTYVM